jgi:hypothetical protein
MAGKHLEINWLSVRKKGRAPLAPTCPFDELKTITKDVI